MISRSPERKHSIHCVCLLRIGALLLLTSMSGASPVALTKVTIIDATGRPPVADGVIVMDQGRITAVGPASTVIIPRNAKIIEKSGKYAIPGLMDASLHLFADLDLATLLLNRGAYSEIITEGAQVALKNGQTTVFDTWGPYADLKAACDAVNGGQTVGPRIYFSGNMIGVGGPISADFREDLRDLLRQDTIDYLNRHWVQGLGPELLWNTADEVGKKVAIYAARDADFLRYVSNSRIEKSFLAFSQESQNAIVKAGHDRGKTVQADVYTVAGMLAAMDAGADILAHCDATHERTIPEAIVRKLAETKISCSVLPVTRAYRESQGKEPDAVYEHSWVNIKNLIDAGVNVMLSTDASLMPPPAADEQEKASSVNRSRLGEAHFLALSALEEIGIEPMKVLQTVTINIARGYKVDKDIGTIEPGKYADVVVLDDNPLTSAKNYRSINLVIKAGEVIDVTKLPTNPRISIGKARVE